MHACTLKLAKLDPFSAYMNKYFSTFSLATLFLCQGVMAAPPNAEPRILRLNGVITANSALEFNHQLSGWINQDPVPAGLIVLLNSPGGNGEAGMKIGHLLRQKKAQVFVTGQCESACVFILAGGVVRAASSDTVGIHAGRLTMTNQNGKILKEINSSQSLTNSFKITSFNSQAHKYFSEMGLSNGFLDVMLSHQTKQTYKLSEYEMQQYGVIGFENEYLRKRAQLFENIKGSDRVNRIELFQRTLSIPRLCKTQSSKDNTFIDCYKAVLYGVNPN